MARRSLRISTSSQATPPRPTPLSKPKSSNASRSTPKKSAYFQKGAAKSKNVRDEASDAELSSSSSSAGEEETSGWEDDVESSSSSGEPEEDSESDSARPKKRQKTTPKGRTLSANTSPQAAKKSAKGQELWRPGVKAGLGPGKQIIIDRPKARSAGKTPYTDDTIHPNTMLFLEELAENNDREWFKMHDPDYRASWKDFTLFLECLQKKLIDIDETIPELPVKDVFFRVYRDIRFSPDHTPYKAHFSAAWSRTGRKGPYAVYYVQIKPNGGSFVGGGLWHPEAEPIARMREAIDRRPERLREALKTPGIRKEFLGGVASDDKKVTKAFVDRNSENALKTKPRDYDADHKEIELLRLKNYTIGRGLDDHEVVGSKAIDRVAELFGCMEPFITYLNSVVMPDEDSGSPSDDSNDEE